MATDGTTIDVHLLFADTLDAAAGVVDLGRRDWI